MFSGGTYQSPGKHPTIVPPVYFSSVYPASIFQQYRFPHAMVWHDNRICVLLKLCTALGKAAPCLGVALSIHSTYGSAELDEFCTFACSSTTQAEMQQDLILSSTGSTFLLDPALQPVQIFDLQASNCVWFFLPEQDRRAATCWLHLRHWSAKNLYHRQLHDVYMNY